MNSKLGWSREDHEKEATIRSITTEEFMTELAQVGHLLGGKFSTAIQRINYPTHKGKPNPSHGKYYFVGSIPSVCYDFETGRSKKYDTEEQAIAAAIVAGATRIQRVDCSFV